MRKIPKWAAAIVILMVVGLATLVLWLAEPEGRVRLEQPLETIRSNAPFSQNAPSSSGYIARKETALSDIVGAIREYSGDRTLYPSDLRVVMKGDRYDLIEIRSGADATYQVYDKNNRSMASLPVPLDDYRIDATDGNAILFVENVSIIKYQRNTDRTLEVESSHLDGAEVYYKTAKGSDPVILDRTNNTITFQVFASLDANEEALDPRLPIRSITVSTH